jgi:hypothetical protein
VQIPPVRTRIAIALPYPTMQKKLDSNHKLFIDDILSSLWTIIESNIAIVCACLPACRLLLSAIFPHLFTSANTDTRIGGNSSSFAHAGTGKNDWTPPSKSNDIYLASVHAVGDNDSEQFILQKGDPSTTDRSGDAGESGIQKVTQFTVKYSRDSL